MIHDHKKMIVIHAMDEITQLNKNPAIWTEMEST